jgi:hypothetical protein
LWPIKIIDHADQGNSITGQLDFLPYLFPMKTSNSFLLLLAFFLPTLLLAQSNATYLHCGRVLDGVGGEMTNKTIVIEDGKITSVADGFVGAAAGAKTVDWKHSTVMPGFIDLHVHVESELNPRA